MEEISLREIDNIIGSISKSTGVDFRDYAFSSFKRRIERYLEMNKIRDLDKFSRRVGSDSEYAHNLINEITVNVTEMFRDPSFWIKIKNEIIPELEKKAVINIWHAACSSGEEVYSMAILLREAGIRNRFTITATDINKLVLQKAESGIYSLKSQETNSKNYILSGGTERLESYFETANNKVQYKRDLIGNVEFRNHNLAQDGPFSQFDLILCRNVLIYFNSDLQEKVLRTFSRSLRDGGYLGIGSKESITWCRSASHFEEVSREEKIYRKTPGRNMHSGMFN